jgi:hypothetical protein
MNRTVRVRVTRQHIAQGIQGDCSHCPLALAFREVGLHVRVGVRILIIDRHPYQMPALLADWADAFDAGREVEPIEFAFELPDELVQAELPLEEVIAPEQDEIPV